ncbi:type I-F CRISPR-associated endoribonuclease Cas6/Csy4 [methane-oxidizing endosymbiont of Gigantopelta aegis]|uniref:type I-F CRISPR-associated endoribonuclease Cas6/Csy4 n=1 Tax=methane-oxidizing endosymbiont of Gigantopelta aegis TaxID=2794938 RepID=UPI0018DECBA9|nr:type I-F CRISPR-associated endoribonuclease Cas6/Csy4 [methane-oxidizing endosymbiont of Gigantopelta aegis]
MDHYIDIRILPDAEMRENVLLNKVYTKFHKALCTLDAEDIGVSFPEYKIKLGRLLRIHSNAERLTELQKMQWLGGLVGYCNIAEIKLVPENTTFRVISRIQTTMSPAKYRRLLARGTITEKEQKQYKAKMFQKGLDNPYMELESASTGKKYRRYLIFSDLLDNSVEGKFDQFGLSKTATVPWFL